MKTGEIFSWNGRDWKAANRLEGELVMMWTLRRCLGRWDLGPEAEYPWRLGPCLVQKRLRTA